MRSFILLFCFFICNAKCFSQSIASNLDSKFHNADSIVLIKHLSTNNPVIIKDGTGKRSIQRRLLNGNKLNKSIVLKRVKLTANQISSLINILTAKERKIDRQTMQCFIPRHSILIYKKSTISYIKLCFECLDSETSSDIKLGEEYFSILKWRKLEDFFSELKLVTQNEDFLK